MAAVCDRRNQEERRDNKDPTPLSSQLSALSSYLLPLPSISYLVHPVPRCDDVTIQRFTDHVRGSFTFEVMGGSLRLHRDGARNPAKYSRRRDTPPDSPPAGGNENACTSQSQGAGFFPDSGRERFPQLAISLESKRPGKSIRAG